MLNNFRSESPSASSYESTDSTTRASSLEALDSDASSSARSKERRRLVDGLALEVELRDERIKELERGYEELMRKSHFDEGQLRSELQLAKDNISSTNERLEQLRQQSEKLEEEKWNAIERAAKLAAERQQAFREARAALDDKEKAVDAEKLMARGSELTILVERERNSTEAGCFGGRFSRSCLVM